MYVPYCEDIIMVNLSGFKVIIVQDTVEEVKRSWAERLFSTPWTPLIKTNNKRSNVLKYKQIIKDEDKGILYMTQQSYDHLLSILPPHPKVDY